MELYSYFWKKQTLEDHMPGDYHHLTYEKRCQIYILKKRGDSDRMISNELGVDRSTIYRETKRNSGKKGYRFKQAHEKALKRRASASKSPKKMTAETKVLIDNKLNFQWSPEQIAGWMKNQSFTNYVSYETIYLYIWKDKRKGGFLYKNLRRRGKKYNKRRHENAGRGYIPGRIDIDQRPAIVEEKERVGDWELDTIIGANHKGAIVSLVDRASKLTKLFKVPAKTSKLVAGAIIDSLSPIRDFVITLTSDNGKEFADHCVISKELKADFFFARPYHSWERGLNEHTNGLVRQYFPKGSSFEKISQNDVERVQKLLNNRPRKVLGFRTPIEAFKEKTFINQIVALQC